LEKWFDERRQTVRVSSTSASASASPPPTNTSVNTTVTCQSLPPSPPGLKRWAKNTDFWNKDELHIPTYDEFVFKDAGPSKKSTNLLPENWYANKWRSGYTNDVCSAWFVLPPNVEEGDCYVESDDLPLDVYKSGRAALDSLPFVGDIQYDFYMTIFQEYYRAFNGGIN
jgi:hypothetical protein